MKFTRFFILRTLNTREENVNNENPFEALKEIIISHPNIDFSLALLLSILMLITKYSDDFNYVYLNSLNFYFIAVINVVTLLYYFVLEYIDQITISGSSNRNLLVNNQNDNQNNQNNEVNGNNNNNSNNPANENNNPFSIININNPRKIKLPIILFNNWHLFKSILHLMKIITTILNYFLSLIFCMLYNQHKLIIDREKYLLIHLLILEFYEFYSGFRVCYFLIKIVINIFLIPVYVSAIILGIIEDKFNHKLNKLINTKLYTGRQSLKSIPNGRVSEMEEYCSICLNSFQIDEIISTLPCSKRHTFHTFCLEKWFLTTVTCPLCRSDFQSSLDFIINGGINPPVNREVELSQHLL